MVPQLRLLCLAEALHAPAARRALDLNAELETLGTALQEVYDAAPAGFPSLFRGSRCRPQSPRQLLQTALLCWVRSVLACPTARAVLQLDTTRQAGILVMRGGLGRNLPGDTRALLLRLAAVCGGAVVQSGGTGPFTAAVRLPLRRICPCCRPGNPWNFCTTGTARCRFFCRNTVPEQTNDRGLVNRTSKNGQ